MRDHDTIVNSIVGGGALAALLTTMGSWLTRGRSAPAETQEQINGGFRAFMTEAQERLLTLEHENIALKQYVHLLEGVLRANGLEVPMASVSPGGMIVLPPKA